VFDKLSSRIIGVPLLALTLQQKVFIRLHIGLWQGSIKLIEGRFGSTNGTFFRLIRFVVYMNLFTGLVMVCGYVTVCSLTVQLGSIFFPQIREGFARNEANFAFSKSDCVFFFPFLCPASSSVTGTLQTLPSFWQHTLLASSRSL
jgi:hypothetical protein